jgi:hypothetical protein
MIQKFISCCLALLLTTALQAQSKSISGKVQDAETGKPLADVALVVDGKGKFAVSDAAGLFTLDGLPLEKMTLNVSHTGYLPIAVAVDLTKPDATVSLEINLKRDPEASTTPAELPTITLEEADAELDGSSEIANLLNANRDVFQQVTGYGWGAFRFRERGYDGSMFQTFINGMPFNDLETGFTAFNEFGGLNDVLRLRTTDVGLNASEFTFGGPGGATFIDTRASAQRKQVRVSYAVGNRTYRNRLMATVSTGVMPDNWSVTLSASRRWGQEGFVEGTFMDAWSYFIGVEKRINNKHSFSFTAFGAPTKRGRSADSFQEMFDLAGSNYYNPLWGYWNGEKRNSSTTRSHQPTGILRYDWTPSAKTRGLVALYGQKGINDFGRLNFINGRNPNPDFNRRLPSSFENPEMGALQAQLLSSDESFRQVNWAGLYDANLLNYVTINNADNSGESRYGRNAIYMLENQRSVNSELGLNAYFSHLLTKRLTINGGAQYELYRGQNYKVVDDLLGADFFVDQDFLGNFDNPTDQVSRNSDLLHPNNVVGEGEIFGWNYDEHIRKGGAWAQAQLSLKRFELFVSGEVGNTQMWREGYMQSGRFPNNSLGESEKISFTTYGVKAGATIKLNGRNYLYANGYTGTRAPLFRNVFFQPRTRDYTVPGIEVSTVQSVEGGYILRNPKYRARITGYFTKFGNETENIFASQWSVLRVIEALDLTQLGLGTDPAALAAIVEQPLFFGATVLRGVERQHAGIEAAIEAKLTPSWSILAATAVGQNIYTNRPDLLISLDNSNAPIIQPGVVYQKDFYVPRTPQTAGTFGIKYEGKRFWFAGLTLNYAGRSFYEFDRVRRTEEFVTDIDRNSDVYRTIIDQQEMPDNYTLDFFGGKSFMIQRGGKRYFMNFNLGVNNLLDNKNILISGREVYRNAFRNDVNDPRFYASEVLYGFGLNYFASLTFRM